MGDRFQWRQNENEPRVQTFGHTGDSNNCYQRFTYSALNVHSRVLLVYGTGLTPYTT